MGRVVTDEKMQAAISCLSEDPDTNDDAAAVARADMDRAEFKAKRIKDALIKHGDGGVGERTAAAGCDPAYLDAMEEYFAASQLYEFVRNKRSTAAIIVDVWRSENAARRQG
jgi:hypothetical protein